MCGIAGIFSNDPEKITSGKLEQLAVSLKHRGPDGSGVWVNAKGNIGFCHRRLSIIDLSENAAQPMHFLSRFTIVYNGEIYNYKELRHELTKLGYLFNTESDTETILAAFAQWKKDCLQRLDGMFAFAIWDKVEQELFLARDRFGEKPLFYAESDNTFYFASEMKALWHIGVPKEINEPAWLFFTATGLAQLPATEEKTFFRNIKTLKPGHFISLKNRIEQIHQKKWYSLSIEVNKNWSEKAATEKVAELLKMSVEKRLRSDVAIGSSLSGGVDSSIIVSLVNDVFGKENFKTFSAVFPGFKKDESQKIHLLQKEWSLRSYTITPNGNDLFQVLNALIYQQEEPIASASVFLQYKIYESAACNGIKVILDGQGADEVFGGYERYLHWYLQEKFAKGNFSELNRELQLLRKNKFDVHWGFKNYAAALFPVKTQSGLTKKAMGALSNTGFSQDYLNEFSAEAAGYVHKPVVKNFNDILHHSITVQGLPELLRYADRNSMAHGAEVRLPYLQHELVEYIFSLPSHLKIKKGFTKYILRKAFEKYMPADIVWQKGKIGYEPPQQQWMAQPSFMELVHQSRQKLVQRNVLNRSISDEKIVPVDSHAGNNNDWRYIMMAKAIH